MQRLLWMGRMRSAVDVQRLARQREMCLADRLGLGGVRVDERSDLDGHRFPVVDQLGLGDELADPGADHVDAEYRTVLFRYELDRALRLEDLALAVATEVVGQCGDLVG